MKIWIGYWLMLVAILHTIVMFVVFYQPLLEIVRRGVFNSIGAEKYRPSPCLKTKKTDQNGFVQRELYVPA
jgi:hypothetical protein